METLCTVALYLNPLPLNDLVLQNWASGRGNFRLVLERARPSDIKKVAASAHFVRSREHGSERRVGNF
jgi:hypothetical protein